MEKPYRYRKKILKVGNGYYVNIPVGSDVLVEALRVKARGKAVMMEVYPDKIVITPAK